VYYRVSEMRPLCKTELHSSDWRFSSVMRLLVPH